MSSFITIHAVLVLRIVHTGRRYTHIAAKPLVRTWTIADNEVDEDSSHATVDPRDQPSPSLLSFVGRVARVDPNAVMDLTPVSDHPTPSTSHALAPSPVAGPLPTPASASPVTPPISKPRRAKKTGARVDEKEAIKTNAKVEKVSSPPVRVFEECDRALQDGAFEPSSWDEFKILLSCRPRPTLHFFSPRDTDVANPTTRFVVDNINAFRHHSTEPNISYANEDIEAMFYFTGAKNVRCFDGRVVDGVVRYLSETNDELARMNDPQRERKSFVLYLTTS